MEELLEPRLNHLLTLSSFVLFSYSPKSDGSKITFMSENIGDVLGYRPYELYDLKFFQSLVHPDDLPRFISEFSSLEKEGHVSNEYRFLHKDGTYIWLHDERKVSYDDEGQTLEIVGSLIDITKRKQSEKAQGAKKNLIDTILTTTPILFAIKDRASIYREVNPAFCGFLGKPKEKIVGKTDYDLFPRNEAEAYRESDIWVIDTGRMERKNIKVTGLDGPICLQVINTVVRNSEGFIEGVLLTMQDNTWQKQPDELEIERTKELESFNKLAMGRELWMVELKKEVNSLLEKMGKKPKYVV